MSCGIDGNSGRAHQRGAATTRQGSGSQHTHRDEVPPGWGLVAAAKEERLPHNDPTLRDPAGTWPALPPNGTQVSQRDRARTRRPGSGGRPAARSAARARNMGACGGEASGTVRNMGARGAVRRPSPVQTRRSKRPASGAERRARSEHGRLRRRGVRNSTEHGRSRRRSAAKSRTNAGAQGEHGGGARRRKVAQVPQKRVATAWRPAAALGEAFKASAPGLWSVRLDQSRSARAASSLAAPRRRSRIS